MFFPSFLYTPSCEKCPGLWGEYFFFTQGSTLPNLDDRTPDLQRVDMTVNFPNTNDKWDEGLQSRYQYAARWTGYISIQFTGFYTFFLGSDDGSQLYLDGALVLDNDGLHGFRERSTTEMVLQGGSIHALTILFFQGGGNSGCVFQYQGSDTGGRFQKEPVCSPRRDHDNLRKPHFFMYPGGLKKQFLRWSEDRRAHGGAHSCKVPGRASALLPLRSPDHCTHN